MKRAIAALIAGLVVFGGVFAFAAGLDVNSNNLAAGEDTVDSCDTGDADVSYVVAFVDGDYEVTTVNLKDLDSPCNGQGVAIVLNDTHEFKDEVVAAGEASFDVSTAELHAEDLVDIDVIVSPDAPVTPAP